MSDRVRYIAGMLIAVFVALCGAGECGGAAVSPNPYAPVHRTGDSSFSAPIEPAAILPTDPIRKRWATERAAGRSTVRQAMEHRASEWLRSRHVGPPDADSRDADLSGATFDGVSHAASAIVADFLNEKTPAGNRVFSPHSPEATSPHVVDIKRITDSLNPDALHGVPSERRAAVDAFLNTGWSVPTPDESRVEMAMRAIEPPPSAMGDTFSGSSPSSISLAEIHSILTDWSRDTVQLAMWIAPLRRSPLPSTPTNGMACVLMAYSPSGAGFSSVRDRISSAMILGEFPATPAGFSDFFHAVPPSRIGFSRIAQTTIRRE